MTHSPGLASDTASSSVSSSNPERALKDVVWSCLITVLACALVSVHPNVPEPTKEPKSWKAVSKRLELICWGLVAPEMLLLWSVRQWMGARRLAKEYQEKGWTMAHGHFLQMGGFMLYQEEEAKEALTPERFSELLASGRVELPAITEAEIQDFSKRDAFFKGFAVIQTAWLLVQCTARAVYGLVLTELELVTVTVALALGAMYFFWWDKPLDVRSSVPVFLLDEKEEKTTAKVDTYADSSRTAKQSPISKLLASPWHCIVSIFEGFHEMTESQHSASITSVQMRVPTFYSSPSDSGSEEERATKLRIASAVALVFGAIYSVGWVPSLLPFPTFEEALLWKACLIIVATATFTVLLEFSGTYTVRQAVKKRLLDAYLLARVVLLAETVIALRQLPPTAYTAIPWTSYIPHV